MKGISPIVATVLLIVIVLTAAGLIGMWFSSFTKENTETISQNSGREVGCSFGIVQLSNLKYCNSSISGWIRNMGTTTLGNLTAQVIYDNSTMQTYPLNLSMNVGDLHPFNISSNSNYLKVRVYTNCSTVADESATVSRC